MKTKHIVAVVGILAMLAFATAAAAATATVTVKVKNAQGMPLTGATVIIQQGTSTVGKQTKTTAAGACSFSGVTTGKEWTVVARDQNGKTAIKKVTVSGTVTVNIQIN